MSNNNTIGERIKELRKGKGWTQATLAEKINISDKAVSKWESGGGNPETSQLPILSKLFGVTIDYLLTGKSNSTIVHMSKFELCAKNDDVDLLSEINNLSGQDEDGQTFFQLICKYQSAKVFAKILADKNQYELLPKSNTCGFMGYCTKVLFLCVISNNIKNINEFGIDAFDTLSAKNWLDNTIMALLTDERVTNDTFNYIFNLHNIRIVNNPTASLYPKIFDFAIEAYSAENNDKIKSILEKRIEFIINIFEDIAEKDKTRKEQLSSYEYNHLAFGSVKILCISEKTIKALININAFNWLRRCLEINKLANGYVMSDRDIELVEMKASNKFSEEDILLQEVLYNGIVNIKELLKSKNHDLIKKILTNYPIHSYELLYNWFNKKDFKSLFEFSVDYNFDCLTQALLNDNLEDIKHEINCTISELTKDNNHYTSNKNRGELQIVCNQNKSYIGNKAYSSYTINIKEIESALCECREKIIKDIDFTDLKNQTSGNLTLEYFESLINNNDLEQAIIKLYVKLESILKYQYKYEESSFEELLNRFCQNELYIEEDDGWDTIKIESPMVNLLHKLRKTRNNFVHSTTDDSEPLTFDEFKSCLEFIFSIDKD